MIEIKGKAGQLGLEDVRQLDGWMRSALADEQWQGKGIVVANLKLKDPPVERRDLIAPNAEKFAKTINTAIITTPQLYEALRQQQAGQLELELFWDLVFEAGGLASLPGPDPR